MTKINAEQLAHFNEEGYLVVRGLLDVERVIEPIINEYHTVLNRLADDLYASGEISSTYAEMPFGQRLTEICAESGRIHGQYFDFSLPQGNVQPDTPFWAGPAVFKALTDKDLLDAVESFIGPEIYSNPVQHVRIKPPEARVPKNAEGQAVLGATSWHQDNGVVLPEADETLMLTVWFPLTEANEENGCLQVVPRSHHNGLQPHCPGGPGGLKVPDQLFDKGEGVAIPMQPGDVLFLTSRTIHGSLSNHSEDVRWSFDLRYNPIGQATGRDAFPGFVARSAAAPESALRDAAAWEGLWRAARDHLAVEQMVGPFNRWDPNDPVCA
ncbi:MAG: phytanoyl-CoA hydroxylase [Candidatus Latescibacterota bacterium]|jgi:phytanoyl-CoA hydroxylase